MSILSDHPKHLELIGRIHVEWTTLEMKLSLVFCEVLGLQQTHGRPILDSLQNHKARRDAVKAAVVAVHQKKSETFDEFTRLERRMNRAATKRNAVAHATWGIDGKQPVVSGPKGNSLIGPVQLRDLELIADQIEAIIVDLGKLFRRLRSQRLPHEVSLIRVPRPRR